MQKILKKGVLYALSFSLFAVLPWAASAEIAPLASVPTPTPAQTASPLVCYDFNRNLKSGNTGEAVRMLQYFLITGEGATIDAAEYGMFGSTTLAAVTKFQEKYPELLSKMPNKQANGNVGPITRAKLKMLYGCDSKVVTMTPSTPPVSSVTNVSLAISNVSLDSTGVTATFCNNGTTNLPSAPFRIRLNGINRDFEVIGAQKAKSCDTEVIPYSAWGLTYDPGTTFTAVTLIDPNNMYRSGANQFPTGNGSTLTVPAVVGAHLSVRSVLLKTTGVQATFCNLGTVAMTSFPVKITVNGTAKNFDIAGAYAPGKCAPMSWTFDNWNLTYTPGTTYTAMVQVDPNNVIQETNEFDNSAVVVGAP